MVVSTPAWASERSIEVRVCRDLHVAARSVRHAPAEEADRGEPVFKRRGILPAVDVRARLWAPAVRGVANLSTGDTTVCAASLDVGACLLVCFFAPRRNTTTL